jgi:hypothetical protein
MNKAAVPGARDATVQAGAKKSNPEYSKLLKRINVTEVFILLF